MSIEPVWDQPLDTSALDADDEVVADKIRALRTEGKKRKSRVERTQAQAMVRIAEMATRNRLRLAADAPEGVRAAATPSPLHPASWKPASVIPAWQEVQVTSTRLSPGEALFADKNPLVIGTSLASSDRWAVAPLTAWADPVILGDGIEFGLTHLSAQGSTLDPGWWRQTAIFGTFYAVFALPRPVPHIVLDARANDVLGSDLPRPFDKSLVIGIDDDFDKVFTTYAPEGAERAVELIFTKKVRDAFLGASTLNVEMVGNALVFFGHDLADFTTPEPWAKAFQLHALVEGILPSLGEYVDGGSVLLTPSPQGTALTAQTTPVAVVTGRSGNALTGVLMASGITVSYLVYGFMASGIIPTLGGVVILGGLLAGGVTFVTHLIRKRKKIARAQLNSDLR